MNPPVTPATKGGGGLCFNPSLSVCEHDISKSCGRIRMKFGGQVGCVTRINWLDLGKDPDPDLTTRSFFSDSSPLRDRAKNDV